MFRRIQARRSREGFTLIELLIVVAIIGIIAVILIPNLLDALQKAKQKSTTADIREMMQALFSWTTDQVGAAAAGAAREYDITTIPDVVIYTDLRDLLVPEVVAQGQIRYIQEIPQNDGWGNPYEYRLLGGTADPDPLAANVFSIRSLGQDNVEGCGKCVTPKTNPYPIGPFPSNEYEQDIVGVDGYFVSWPAGAQTGAAAPTS